MRSERAKTCTHVPGAHLSVGSLIDRALLQALPSRDGHEVELQEGSSRPPSFARCSVAACVCAGYRVSPGLPAPAASGSLAELAPSGPAHP